MSSQQPRPAMTTLPSITSLPSKTFNDPIHGFIQVEHMLVAIIDTPYFQRLRHLVQLGACPYVFPGASHTRFSHSIGTMHLAGQLVEKLREKDPGGKLSITPRLTLLIKAAGLCHDLGHGPLSHSFDGVFIPAIVDLSTTQPALAAKLSTWSHEDASEMMLEAAIQYAGLMDETKYDDPLSEDDVTFMKQLINFDHGTQKIYPQYAFAYDIVSNSRCSVDVDKFDYIERDSVNSGLRSAFRYDHLLQNCRVIDQKICFNRRIAFHLYELFHTRYSLFKQLYYHSKVACCEYMIIDALKLAEPVLHIAERVFSPHLYLNLDDTIVQQIEYYPIHTIDNERHRQNMENAQHILKRLRNRDLYRFCGESLLPSTATKQLVKVALTPSKLCTAIRNLHPESTLTVEDFEIQIFSLNYANKDRNPMDTVLFYDSSNDTKCFTIPADQISLLSPNKFSELYARVYIRKNDCTEAMHAVQAFDQCLKDAGFPGSMPVESDQQYNPDPEIFL